MSIELFQHYGYCEIPKGTKLYRAGEVYIERGATFALHPTWAMNFTAGSSKIVYDYEVTESINVLFLVAHLDKRGFPVSAIKELYNTEVEQDDYIDDIGIKFRNISANSKFKQMLRAQGIQGWLTTMEGNPPLEVFLFSDSLKNIKNIGELSEEIEVENSLRKINVKPSQLFLTKSKANIKENYAYLFERSLSSSDSFYGLFHKLFS